MRELINESCKDSKITLRTSMKYRRFPFYISSVSCELNFDLQRRGNLQCPDHNLAFTGPTALPSSGQGAEQPEGTPVLQSSLSFFLPSSSISIRQMWVDWPTRGWL